MAKKAKIFTQIFLGVASALTLSFASQISPAHACAGDETGETNCVEETQLISPAPEDTYGEAGSEVKSEKIINHSFFLAGNQVVSNDTVKGLSAFAGSIVELNGKTEYGALGGSTVTINGSVEKDLFVAGKDIKIAKDAKIGRDFYAAGSTFRIEGALGGNAFVGGQTVTINGATVAGNLKIAAEEIIIEEGATVTGSFQYNESAKVTGLEKLTAGNVETFVGRAFKLEINPMTGIQTAIIFLIAKLLAVIIFVAIASGFSKRLINEFELKNSWKDLALGLGVIIAAPLAIVLGMVSVIGLPISIIGLGFYVLFLYFSTAATGGVVGNILAKKLFKKDNMHILLKYTIGLLTITLLTLLPYIGGLISAISTCFGFGYITHKVFRKTAKKK